MEDYKIEIEQTRVGNVGSSDAKMLQQIAEWGSVPQSALKRLAVVKGLVENKNITTAAMRYGDFIENEVYKNLVATDSRWQSNPCIVSKKYSRKNVSCLTHVDFMLQDDENKSITVCECKCTRFTYEQTRNEYKYQLSHHYLLMKEYAKNLGGYSVQMLLVHYDASGVNLDEEFEFDSRKLTVKRLRKIEQIAATYRLSEAMNIIDNYLETMTEYYEDEIDWTLLPEKVRNEFNAITSVLAEIKDKEKMVDDFKKRLTEFMTEKNIKSIKTDEWNITLVSPSESVSVDYKNLFVKEFEEKKPRIAKRLKEVYKKTTKKSAFVVIKLKEKKNQ